MPGEGTGIDHAALLSHLSTVGYEGPITVYVNASAFPGLKRDAIVQKASAVLEGLLTAAGVDKTGQPLVVV